MGYEKKQGALLGECPCWRCSSAWGALADGAGAEVAGVGDEALVVGAAADGEAVEVDAVAVPVGGDADFGAFLDAEDGLGEDAGLGLGAVDEDVGFVGRVGADDGGIVVDGNVDLEGVGEGGGAELDFGEVALGDDEVFVVDGGGTGGVGVDAVPVEVDEDVAFGGAFAAGDFVEAESDGGDELAGEGADGTEAGADELLGLGVEVVDLTFVGAHDGLAFPEGADDGADFSDESVKDSLLYFSHDLVGFGWFYVNVSFVFFER